MTRQHCSRSTACASSLDGCTTAGPRNRKGATFRTSDGICPTRFNGRCKGHDTTEGATERAGEAQHHDFAARVERRSASDRQDPRPTPNLSGPSETVTVSDDLPACSLEHTSGCYRLRMLARYTHLRLLHLPHEQSRYAGSDTSYRLLYTHQERHRARPSLQLHGRTGL